MKKIYEHDKLSLNWYSVWERANAFIPDYNKSKTYCITIPPPNITGKLHMGHAFQCALMDMLIRYYKMNQFSTLWKMGTDHAGIATQLLIEKNFKTINLKDRYYYAYKWKKKSVKNIKTQLKLQGCSLNWNTARFTLDKHFSYAVKMAFIKLYNDKLIFKSKKLVNWDSSLQTAISDLETIYKEEDAKLYYVKYKLSHSQDDYIIIATTRPETIFADSAIAVNPCDKRYLNFKNKKVIVPIIEKEIPIIYDNIVDINFGTGCLKITPAHDFKDFELAKRHKLSMINIFTKNGCLNDAVPDKYKNLTIEHARKQVFSDLLNLNLIEKVVKYKNKVPRGDRTNNVIEPYLTEQWYVDAKKLIVPVKNALDANELKIVPIKWKKVFFNWINNIKDWCISRQIWWGHKIPIWYDRHGNEYVGENERRVRILHKIDDNEVLEQETDVLDTWFSSALWPFASLGWPNNTKEYTKFYPTNTLITGFDIIFFWAIRMMMFGLKFTNILPFKEIYIHGLIQDNLGNKMSKTKGNVLDPSDIINGITCENLIKKQINSLLNKNLSEKVAINVRRQFPNGISGFGIDTVRLTFTSFATDNMSIKINLEKFRKYRNFCNKVWNAAKFIRNNVQPIDHLVYKNTLSNIWIVSLWQSTKKLVIQYIENRSFQLVNETIYHFIWNDFCSFYLETVKHVSNNKKYSGKTKEITCYLFNEIIKVLHPIAPFLTEEINYLLNDNAKSLLTTIYPKINYDEINNIMEKKIILLREILTKIRKINNGSKVANKSLLICYLYDYKHLIFIEEVKNMLIKFVKVTKVCVSFKKNNDSVNVLDNLAVFILQK